MLRPAPWFRFQIWFCSCSYLSMRWAQGPCPTANSTNVNVSLSRDLICIVPQVYGAGGLVGSNHGGHPDATDKETCSHVVYFHIPVWQGSRPLPPNIGR